MVADHAKLACVPWGMICVGQSGVSQVDVAQVTQVLLGAPQVKQ